MRKSETKQKLQEIRDLCEADLFSFAKLVNPTYVYGDIHERVFKWLQAEEEGLKQLLLLPRGHLKSHCMAVWCAWHITNNPDTIIVYLSATSTLAELQLKSIQNMLTHPNYTRVWPEMLNRDEGKREKWSASAIAVDHPKRKSHNIREATVQTAGLTTNTTGWHCDILISDDVVVPENAYTEDGRRKTAANMGQMHSILNPAGMLKACGTRYHPQDYYQTVIDTEIAIWDMETDEILDYKPAWDIMEEVVEIDGNFLWPRSYNESGTSAYGFNRQVLEEIKGGYTGDIAQFFSQYYNDPNDESLDRISRENFQYYEPAMLRHSYGQWVYGKESKPLNIYAAVDFAFSLSKASDYTAIVVIGVDEDGNYYVLDIDRFKTDRISTYFEHIVELHSKWNFRKLRAEANGTQLVIVNDLKNYIKREGLTLIIDAYKPNRHQGNKEERISAILDHKYEQQAMWHFQGGYTSALEEELVLLNPPHDDIKDALAAAVDVAVIPMPMRSSRDKKSNIIVGRFGGVAGTRRR